MEREALPGKTLDIYNISIFECQNLEAIK